MEVFVVGSSSFAWLALVLVALGVGVGLMLAVVLAEFLEEVAQAPRRASLPTPETDPTEESELALWGSPTYSVQQSGDSGTKTEA